MAIMEMFGAKMVLSKAPSWSKEGYVIKRYPRRINTPNQLKAQIALSEAAYNAYGSEGMVAGIPAVAAAVQSAVPKGVGVHGGKSRKQIAEENHAAARASIEALKSKLAASQK